jgi:hypothetical protein
VAKTTISSAILLVIAAAAVAADSTEGTADQPTLFVHIENRGAVLPETLGNARKQLAHIFDAAGVRVESTIEPGHDRCAGQLTVHVLLLAGTIADRFIKSQQVGRNVLAQANSDARRVYVFWDRVGPAVDHQAIDRGDALGVVIAHELGHVLLPGRGHSRSGLMQANYEAFFSYGLKFDSQESAALRAFITAKGLDRVNP